MDINLFFKSIIDQDKNQIVICNLDYNVIYINPAAEKLYGKKLLGSDLRDCHNERSNKMTDKAIYWFSENKSHNIIHTYYDKKDNEDVYIVALRNDREELIGFYEKHESRNREECRPYSFI